MTDHMEAAAALLRASRAGKVSMADIERRWSGMPDVRMATRPWADYGDEDPGAGSLADVGEQVARCGVWQTGGMVVEDMRAGDAPVRLDDVVFRARPMSEEEAEKKEQLRRYAARLREETRARETDSPLMDAADDVAFEYSDGDGASLYVWPETDGRIAFSAENGTPKTVTDYTLVKVSREKASALAKAILRATGGES